MLRGRAEPARDELQLVHVRVTREVRQPDDQLDKDQRERVDVDGGGVVLCAKEELGRAVPARDDVAGHGAVGVAEAAGEAEIGEFELAVGGEEEIVGFDILVGGRGVRVTVSHVTHSPPPTTTAGKAETPTRCSTKFL